ncbi:Hypothetical predicted protein [Podarcis lilfordi]|uniref:Uncharacterized protein n=1 Tax=Podarcis lilfordi TaxID=74358 RepID=A0AA35P4C6_9SAUR|nr:Hypothetical predicted protein [Podarcis lilfordi]
MVPNGCKCSPERFGGRNRRLLSQDKKSAFDNFTGRKRFFLKKIPKPRGHNFSKNLTFGNSLKNGTYGYKCSPERFGGRNRRLFITGKEIIPRQLNRQKKIFEKIPKPRGHNFIKNLTFGNSLKNGAKRLQMLP